MNSGNSIYVQYVERSDDEEDGDCSGSDDLRPVPRQMSNPSIQMRGVILSTNNSSPLLFLSYLDR